jgi:4'-phosphopantetheinyl transferase
MTINELIGFRAATVCLPEGDASWQLSPINPKLKSGEVHVWLSRLDYENAEEFERIISADERARAERFRFDLHRNQFVVARGLLRVILGEYLQTNPSQLRFEYGKYGKPSIGGEFRSAIKFNVSHSDNLALYAVSADREIGVDIERIDPSSIEEMISQCLTSLETKRFQNLPENKRNLFFFDCWTRKEAYLKACGNGFLVSPNQIETSLSSELSMSFLTGGAEPRQTICSFQTLPPIPGHATALAVEGSNPQLKFWRR